MITIASQLQIIGPTSLSPGTVGLLYGTVNLSATGGITPYAWSGSGLPNGLSVSPTGALVGTPAAGGQGTYHPQFTVTDSIGASVSAPLTLTINAPPAVTSPPAPGGEVGTAYSLSFSASGGTAPYSNWTVSAGSLPPGLALSPSLGVISGIPTAAGIFKFSVTVTDSAGLASALLPLTITINPRASGSSACVPTGLLIQSIAPHSGFSAVMGQPVSVQVSISDDCGTPVLTGKGSAVLATFSNNDPSIVLGGAGSGKWVGTWLPASGQGGVIVEVSAFEALTNGTILGGRVDVSGLIQSKSTAALSVTQGALTFSLSQGAQASSQPVTIVNQGSLLTSLQPHRRIG